MGHESSRRQSNIGPCNTSPARCFLPHIDRCRHLLHHLPGRAVAKSVERRRAENHLQIRPIVDVVDVQDMLRFVDVRVDVKRWREAPPCLAKHEAVVAQVIVSVADRDVECHATEKLCQVCVCMFRIALGPDELRQFR